MSKPRRGVVLIVVMVCLAVAMVLVVSWLKIAAVERRTLRDQKNRAQAEWLAESALSRAASRLGTDADYRGEIWSLTAEEIGGGDPAEIEIVIEPIAEKPNRRHIRVRADYPTEERRRHRTTKQIDFAFTSNGASS